MATNSQNADSLKPAKAYTIFMVPFYYEGEWKNIYQKYDRWQPIMENLYTEDVLYPYIMDLFSYESLYNKSSLLIYEFNSSNNGINSKMFVDRILGKKQIALLGKNAEEKKNPQQINFTLLNEGNFAPHLFVSPTAKIGLLTFSIELENTCTTEQHISLNYWLHKRNELDKYQNVCLKPEEQEETEMLKDSKLILDAIPGLWKKSQKNTRKEIDYVCWNINDFVDCIMGTMGEARVGEERIQYFSSYRMHLFSFRSMQDSESQIKPDDINRSLIRLSRCVNSNYLLLFDKLKDEGAVLQTYENIYFSSAIEGASMICIGKKDNEKFIADIHSKFSRQYLLIYILVLLQRYTLQSIERKLTEYESTDKKSDTKLWSLIDVVCRIKTNCYYTDVSIYSHHSQFYQFCCKNLRIPETFKEVSEKIELLKLTTDRNMQQVQKKSERLQRLLNIIVAILTIAQVMQAVFELSTAEEDITFALDAGKVCFGIIILAYLWSYFKDFFTIKNNKKTNYGNNKRTI